MLADTEGEHNMKQMPPQMEDKQAHTFLLQGKLSVNDCCKVDIPSLLSLGGFTVLLQEKENLHFRLQ